MRRAGLAAGLRCSRPVAQLRQPPPAAAFAPAARPWLRPQPLRLPAPLARRWLATGPAGSPPAGPAGDGIGDKLIAKAVAEAAAAAEEAAAAAVAVVPDAVAAAPEPAGTAGNDGSDPSQPVDPAEYRRKLAEKGYQLHKQSYTKSALTDEVLPPGSEVSTMPATSGLKPTFTQVTS